MFVRCFFVLAGIAAAVAFSGLTLPRESLAQDVRHMCSEKYQAAKAAGTLGEETWPQFYSRCTAKLKANPPSIEAQSPSAQESASKEETLNAIKSIYEGQPICRDNSASEQYIQAFKFSHFDSNFDDKRVNFSCYFGSTRTTYSKDLNPADIDRAEFINRRRTLNDGRIVSYYYGLKLIGRTTSEIVFCDSNARDRIYRAILYLRQFYKRTPF